MRQAHGPAGRPHEDGLNVTAPRMRRALATLAGLLCTVLIAACGGSSVSDAVPKSTPDITPPTDTSAEKAALQTTSTSTTATKPKTSTSESSGSEAEGETPEGETGGSASEGTASGGTGSEEKKPEEKAAAKTEEGASSPTGGASAP